MTALPLEDFGGPDEVATPAPAPDPAGTDRFDEGYSAGWDDAVARIDADQARLGTSLQETLTRLEARYAEATDGVIAALEPALRDIFDTLLPKAAQAAFLPVLLDEVTGLLRDEARELSVLVAPEEASALNRLLERAGETAAQVKVRPEPALAVSQALVRWDGQERRIDMEAVLAALDGALDAFLSELTPGARVAAGNGYREARDG
ncbi:hypothetical protein [Jannaschia ovalis]|uniref:Flagellar assembly protein FliH n=1 Tax=Jannaschia ovalis TaxID=3038773 RepID=A0ABY8LJ26_9RHOB|nr:hypothetical protein [Jannaschia sp. GRR-S6-38]WGH80165.1 hypothetical protein P8627_07840 [Jannaschia sp. GRR-S6-38]